MRKRLAIAAVVAIMTVGVAGTASAAPGRDIRDACGASFGQLVSGARSAGTSVHGNYAGGAAAFADPAILVAHGCTG
jgi:hypothetical protein